MLFLERFTPYRRQWQISPLPYIFGTVYLLSLDQLVQLIYLFHEAKFIHWCVHACDINFAIPLSMINGFFSGETKKDKRWHRQSKTSAGKYIIFSCWPNLASPFLFQDLIRMTDLKDRSIMEHNFERVNLMSIFYVVLMIAAGFGQVVLLRSLFDERSKINPLWKKAFND